MSLNYNINLNVNKGAFQHNVSANIISGVFLPGMLAVTLDLETTTQAITTVTMSNLGMCFARSLADDTTGTTTVSFGRLSGTTLFAAARLFPGEAGLFRLAPGDYGAVANAPKRSGDGDVSTGNRLMLIVLEQ